MRESQFSLCALRKGDARFSTFAVFLLTIEAARASLRPDD